MLLYMAMMRPYYSRVFPLLQLLLLPLGSEIHHQPNAPSPASPCRFDPPEHAPQKALIRDPGYCSDSRAPCLRNVRHIRYINLSVTLLLALTFLPAPFFFSVFQTSST